MEIKITLSKFNGKRMYHNSFLVVDTNGNVIFDLSNVKLRNWRKAIQLKKDALIFYERYTKDIFKREFLEDFCKRYPLIDWHVSFTATSGINNEFTIECDYPIKFSQLHEKIRSFCNISADTFHLCEDLDYYSKLLDKKILQYKAESAGIYVGENAVFLTNGKYLVSNYYNTRHLKFVVNPTSVETLNFSSNKEEEKRINIIWENPPEFMYGNYKESEKRTPLFYPCDKSKAKHILIKMETNTKDVYGENYPIKENIYHEFNTPYIFNIIKNGTKSTYNEEDI